MQVNIGVENSKLNLRQLSLVTLLNLKINKIEIMRAHIYIYKLNCFPCDYVSPWKIQFWSPSPCPHILMPLSSIKIVFEPIIFLFTFPKNTFSQTWSSLDHPSLTDIVCFSPLRIVVSFTVLKRVCFVPLSNRSGM